MNDKHYYAEWRKRKKASGVCFCNKPICAASTTYCEDCLVKNRERGKKNAKKTRGNKKNNKECIRCKNLVCCESKTFCSICLKKHRKTTSKMRKTANPLTVRYWSIKGNAKARGLECYFKRQEFIDWFNQQIKTCHYCGVNEDKLSKIDHHKSKLTIDRKNNNIGHTIDNICLACFRCNNTKSNFFTENEWLDICNKYIKPRIDEYHSK